MKVIVENNGEVYIPLYPVPAFRKLPIFSSDEHMVALNMLTFTVTLLKYEYSVMPLKTYIDRPHNYKIDLGMGKVINKFGRLFFLCKHTGQCSTFNRITEQGSVLIADTNGELTCTKLREDQPIIAFTMGRNLEIVPNEQNKQSETVIFTLKNLQTGALITLPSSYESMMQVLARLFSGKSILQLACRHDELYIYHLNKQCEEIRRFWKKHMGVV